RPVPGRLLPLAGGATVVALALPVFLIAGWPLAGWALGAVLWVGGELLGLVLARVRAASPGNAASGVMGVGMMFRGIAVMAVLLAVVVSNASVGIAAALVYALAYTLELMLSLVTYFGTTE
ncbi:MAG: hypothetical protein ACXVZW_12840, partial [Gaiellaceae bacterium]